MRRPKNPADGKHEDAAPSGGRARKRLEQFNRARGLPAETPGQPQDGTPEVSRHKDSPPGKKKSD